VIAVLVACGGEEPLEPYDPPGHDGETALESIDATCDGAGWVFRVRTTGWASMLRLEVVTDDVWEEHPFGTEPETYDPGGAWDEYVLELTIVPEESEAESGESTFVICEEPSATWFLEVDDREGGAVACAAWGDRPEEVAPQCEEWSI